MSDEATDRMAKARAAKAAKNAAGAEETESVEARRARLMAELAELPPAELPSTLIPGTVIGEGANAQEVPFTKAWFEKNYEMVEFIPPEDGQANVNGVLYAWRKGKKTRVPAPHYDTWVQSQEALEAGRRMYDPPANLVTTIPGYTSPVFRMGEGLLEPIPDDQ